MITARAALRYEAHAMRRRQVSRRELLSRASALGVTGIAPLGLAACDDEVVEPAPRTVFLHGVASGDPLTDAVILWTRVTTPGGEPVEVAWEIATDPAMTNVVASGPVTAEAERDHTVKVDVDGLTAGTTYYYRFEALFESSPIGRTRTAPAGEVARLRIGVCSCASLAHGYFNVYRRLAARSDLDLVIHLGDYIYEYGDGEYGFARGYDPPHEVVTLEDYRRRYAHYRRDADLREVHRQHPFVAVWDDHESADNSWPGGAVNHTSNEGAWADRLAGARQAYFEWMPVREQPDGRLQRRISLGGLADLIMLDTRLWARDEQALDQEDPRLVDPERTLLGDDQEAWLAGELAASTARWKILGQQVMVAQLPQFLNTDQWDGYPAARERLFALLRDQRDVVVLTGDIHASAANDLIEDPMSPDYDPATGVGSLAVEVVVPGVTSEGLPDAVADIANTIKEQNRYMKLADVTRRGYALLDIDAERVQAAWFYVDTIEQPSDNESFGGAAAVRAGQPFFVLESEPAPPVAGPAPAPPDAAG
jgi:alkaline phosphatase D